METWIIKAAKHVEEREFRARWESDRDLRPGQPDVDFTFLEGDTIKVDVHSEPAESWNPGELFKALEKAVRQTGSRTDD